MYAHEQIRTSEQHVESIHVFGNSPIRCFAVSELPLHDQKRMFHLTPYCGFPMLNDILPVDPVVLSFDVQGRGSAVDSELDL